MIATNFLKGSTFTVLIDEIRTYNRKEDKSIWIRNQVSKKPKLALV